MIDMAAIPNSLLRIPSRQRIEGVYDLRTLRSLIDLGVTSFAFDFRPKSPSFLQQHKFLEIMAHAYSPLHKYNLIYENEKNYIVQKMIDDLIQNIAKVGGLRGMNVGNFMLDFRGQEDAAYYRSFNFPYALDYAPRAGLKEAFNSTLLSEVGISYQMAMLAHAEHLMPSFSRNLSQVLHSPSMRPTPKLILRCDWDIDLYPSIFDFLDVDELALPINNKIEVCYRNVDLGKLKGQLKFFVAERP
jgi:hypothetical protein